jgi:hypothetical protein
MHAGLKSLFKKNNVELIAARGTITAPGSIKAALVDEAGQPTGEERTITATDIVIATGSSVRSIPGLETDGKIIVDSDDIVTGTLHPQRVIVVGGGVNFLLLWLLTHVASLWVGFPMWMWGGRALIIQVPVCSCCVHCARVVPLPLASCRRSIGAI